VLFSSIYITFLRCLDVKPLSLTHLLIKLFVGKLSLVRDIIITFRLDNVMTGVLCCVIFSIFIHNRVASLVTFVVITKLHKMFRSMKNYINTLHVNNNLTLHEKKSISITLLQYK